MDNDSYRYQSVSALKLIITAVRGSLFDRANIRVLYEHIRAISNKQKNKGTG